MARTQQLLAQITERFVADLVRLLGESTLDQLAKLAAERPGTRSRQTATQDQTPPPAAPRPRGRPRKTPLPTAPTSPAKKRSAPAVRRSSAEVERLQERIVAQVAKDASTEGVTSRQLGKALRVPVEDLMRPLIKALRSNQVRQQGKRNQSRYFPAT